MSLNTIKLNTGLLVSLYEKVLVEKEVQNSAPKYLGENRKKITVLVNYPNRPFLPDEALQFLTNILAACKLSLSDIALVNWAQQPLSHSHYKNDLGATRIIAFDLDALQLSLPMNFPKYQVQEYDKCIYLCAPELESVQNDKGEKQQLWAALQKMFSL